MDTKGKNVIVVGTPRSGTSLTSAIFARKGYFVGQIESPRMREGDEGNPFGYFEADDVIERNVEIFRRVDYPEHNTWLKRPISDEQIRRIAALEPSEAHRRFVEDYQAKSPWLWKEPRLTLTLGYWWQLVDPDSTAVIVLEREVEDSIRSFQRLGWIGDTPEEEENVRRRILRHRQAAEEAIALHRIPHIRIGYADYFQRPEAVARRLSEAVGVEIAAVDLNVKRELNHSSLSGKVSTWVKCNLDRPVIRQLRYLKRFLPTGLLRALFPEKKYTPGS